MSRFSWGIWLVVLLCSCRPQGEEAAAGGDQPSAPASSGPNSKKRTNSDPASGTPRGSLGEGEVRVALLVLPGDALVEVGNAPAQRRNGMVELVGKAGEERRVKVFLNAATEIEKTVKIEATGVTPPLIDAEEEAKLRSRAGKTPVVFDINE